MQALSFIISATLPNPFYEASIILTPKPDKDATGKKITGQHTCKSPQQNTGMEEFLGGLVVRILGFHQRGLCSFPGWETEIQQATRHGQNIKTLDFTGGSVVKTLPFDTRGVGSIPGQGTKVPHATKCGQLKKKNASKGEDACKSCI